MSGGPGDRFPRPDYAGLSRYAPDRRPVEVDLSDNTNLWGTHPEALRALREAVPERLARYPHLYADDLRAALAARYDLPEACLCTGCGSDDVLDAAFRTAARSGGLVRYATPTFSMVAPLVVMNGRTDGAVPWSRAMADPEALLEGDPVLVYVCRPNNPTGHQAPDGWMAALLEAVAARGGAAPLLVVDEAYADFADPGDTLLARAAGHPRLLVTRTLSKAFGLAGLRVGWGAGSPEVVDEVEKARGPYKVSRVSEAAAVAALGDASGWVEETVEAARANRARLRDELDGRGLCPFPSAANFLLFPVPRGSARTLALALREHGVAVRPFADDEEIGDALRVTVGPWPLMKRFLEALDAERERAPRAWICPDAAERRAVLGTGEGPARSDVGRPRPEGAGTEPEPDTPAGASSPGGNETVNETGVVP